MLTKKQVRAMVRAFIQTCGEDTPNKKSEACKAFFIICKYDPDLQRVLTANFDVDRVANYAWEVAHGSTSKQAD